MGWRWKLIWIWINERITFVCDQPTPPLLVPFLPPHLYRRHHLQRPFCILFRSSWLSPSIVLLLVTHQPFLGDISPSPSPPPPPRTEQLPANQHTFIIMLYCSYRSLVAFSRVIVTCSLPSMLFSFQRHMPHYSSYHVLLSFSLFLLPSPVVRLLSNVPMHHTPYTIYTSLPPPHTLYSHTSFHCCRVTIAHHLASSVGFPSIHPSPHCYILQTYLCITIFIHSHIPLPRLPSTLLPPPSGLGCCFPFFLPFFHRYNSDMSTCPLTSSKVLTQSRIPGFLRSLMISPYTIPTCFFYTLRALPLFFQFNLFRSLIHIRRHVFFLNLVYLMYICTVALSNARFSSI